MMYKESTPADYDEKVMLHAIRNHTRQTAYLADLRSGDYNSILEDIDFDRDESHYEAYDNRYQRYEP